MILRDVLHWTVIGCLSYLLLVNAMYAALILVSAVENAVRRRESAAEDYDTIAASRFTIPVSVIVAAHNEEPAISACVRSLLSLDYPEHEVIVVNDGSTDGTLDRLRADFGLEPYEVFYRRVLPTAEVSGFYRSSLHPSLIVVDKANGGKADALNAGINLARYRYVCGVDADVVLDENALLKGMRLVMQDPARVVGVTSHLAVALSPEQVMAQPPGKRRVDARPLLAFQHLDYLRAFFNNRIAWSRLGFMLCAVGAFQLWRRDLLEELGGFANDFTCEDIELTFRAHERLRHEGRPYSILCLPDTVGTTEGPDSVRNLVSQRERWQRVITETVWHYRRMTFNPRYGTVGLLGMPFYVLSEIVAPVFELASVLSLGLAFALNVFDAQVFALMVLVIAFGNGVLSAAAILSDDRQSRLYRFRDVARLLILAPFDLFVYRPIVAWARLKGSWRFLRRDKGWHKFERNPRTAPAGP